MDATAVLAFDKTLSQWPPERFVEEILVSALGARAVVVGETWRFGHKAAGNVTLLRELGERLGFEVVGMPLVEVEGLPASSSRVREAIATGDLDTARTLLGRPFDVDGLVQHGADRGASLGFPTANLAVDPSLADPPIGVYAGRALVDGRWHLAATNLGVNPTFGGEESKTPPVIESYLLDFDDDLYGKVLRVEFWKRLRDEKKFDSVDTLVEQMKLDVEATREVLSSP